MKLTSRFPAFLLGLGIVAALHAQEVKFNPATAQSSQAAPATPAAPKYTEEQLLETYGWYLGKQAGLSELGFTQAQTDIIVRGLQSAASGQEAPYDVQKIGPALGEYMQGKQQQYLAKLKLKSAAENTVFFAKLKEDKSVVVLPDGLCYKIIKAGAGDYPKPTQVVKVNYTGQLLNGTVFDSSDKHGGPAEIALDQVIPGWTEGIQKISKGGRIRLYIPAELAYGDQPPRGIPPGSTLVFDVELIDFKDAPPAPPAPPAPADSPTK
ncbi:MAG TPA: FKBP-type peptidyl-prolyl cis-trans isomerase [Opitutaceae bacterium]|jgi:FKBP-type peptidyl-prolyl cis-trans isomerase|nr:FKBP-type peptidyl-prolyl cis-trans isomerase [Opitutaceae bacterium]